MLERIKQVVAQLMSEFARPQVGNVWDYDPTKYAVKLQIQPSGEISGWIPIGSAWVGNNFGLVTGPNVGDLVRVDFVDGNWQAQLVGSRFFTDSAVPPAVPAGECWAVHSTGASIKLTNDGKVTVTDKAGSTIVMNADGTGTLNFASGLTINANTTVNGWVHASGNVTAGSIGLQEHVHSGVVAGGSLTGGPQG